MENCQVGVFVAYAGKDASTLVDERLYLPRAWAFDEARRRKAKVPTAVDFKKPWELADEMLRHVGPRLPHRWIVGDTEFGRSTAFRDRLAKRGERYALEVPSTMVVRKVARPKVGRPPTWKRARTQSSGPGASVRSRFRPAGSVWMRATARPENGPTPGRIAQRWPRNAVSLASEAGPDAPGPRRAVESARVQSPGGGQDGAC